MISASRSVNAQCESIDRLLHTSSHIQHEVLAPGASLKIDTEYQGTLLTFPLQSVFLCLAVCFMVTSAAPREEAIPEGFEGPGSESVNPSDDQSFLLKLKLLKKLLFLG